MTINDAQRLLRQQIGFAKLHRDLFCQRDCLPVRRAALQASLIALNIGLLEYVKSLAGQTSARSLCDVERGAAIASADYRHEEVFTLLTTSQSWLYRLSQVVDSIGNLPETKNEILPNNRGEKIIVSTTGVVSTHWTQVTLQQMEEFIVASEELVDRHVSSDQEC